MKKPRMLEKPVLTNMVTETVAYTSETSFGLGATFGGIIIEVSDGSRINSAALCVTALGIITALDGIRRTRNALSVYRPILELPEAQQTEVLTSPLSEWLEVSQKQ